jgi:hypothetical protein
MLLNIIYTLEVRDGDNEYNIFVPVEVKANSNFDIVRINEVGEQTAKTYISNPTSKTKIGDWYELEYGCRMIRYKNYEIIPDQKSYDLIKLIIH